MRSTPTSSSPDPSFVYPRRLINVTFRVDDLVLLYAGGRAFREGTSLNALVNRFLEDYSDVHPPAWARPKRRIARRGLVGLDVRRVRGSWWFRERMAGR